MAATTPVTDLSRGPVLLSLSIGTACFAFSTTFVRFFVKSRTGTGLGTDDYALGVATVVALVGTIFSIVEGSMSDNSRALEFNVLGQPWSMMASTLSKISICLFFIRLLGSALQWRILLIVLIVLMAIVNLAFSLTVNLQCRPLEKFWNPSADGTCWDPSVLLNFGYFQGAFSVFTWFFLALFPIMILRHVQMRGSLRWPFYFLSSLSFVAAIFSIVRTYETSSIGGLSMYTYDTFCVSLLAILEQNIGLIAANAPSAGDLFHRHNAKHIIRQAALRAQTPSRAGSTRPITRTSTRVGTSHSNHSSSTLDLKRATTLIIEGPRRRSFDTARDDEYYELEDGIVVDPEAWPKGIIKTVSVEVVEELNPDHVAVPPASNSKAGGVPPRRPVPAAVGVPAAVRASDGSMEQDWETMLRAGPPGS